MFTNKTSIKTVVERKLHFRPPYCPNEKCSWHFEDVAAREGRFRRHGTRPIRCYPYITIRFLCLKCLRVFSDSIFSLSYRDRTPATYREIFEFHMKGASRRQIAATLCCSVDTVQRRLQEIARQSFLLQAKKTKDLRVKESIAYDGVENFAFSQFDPNNINHAVGRESYFLYDFNFSPMNRKGSVSPQQRRKKRFLEEKFAPYPSGAIRAATKRVLERLLGKTEGELHFHSDNHYAYRQAIRSLKDRDRLLHFITPAKLARNFRNRLFAINHLDLLTRHHLATFRRETIAFAKHSIAMIESFALFMVWKNFMRVVFTKKHVSDPTANTSTPAMRLGLEKRRLTFLEFFRTRATSAQARLNEDWAGFVRREDPTSRRPIASA